MPTGRIGPFTVLGTLGGGTGSTVYHVRRGADAREYALKAVTAASGAKGRFLDQLRREFRVGRQLDHPNLVRTHALEVETNWLFAPTRGNLLLEFVPGAPLVRHPQLTPAAWVRVFAGVAAGLAYMHDRGLCHADLKPENVMLRPDGVPKVIDFGLAMPAGESRDRFQGTPEYMAPETKRSKVVTPSTDVFNLGATMYRLLTLRFLPASAPGLPLDRRGYARALVPVGTLNPDLPDDLCDLVHWCVGYEPTERPHSMAEVAAALRDLAGG